MRPNKVAVLQFIFSNKVILDVCAWQMKGSVSDLIIALDLFRSSDLSKSCNVYVTGNLYCLKG